MLVKHYHVFLLPSYDHKVLSEGGGGLAQPPSTPYEYEAMILNKYISSFQDYSKFSDENFDVKDWVNAAFRNHKEGNKDVC